LSRALIRRSARTGGVPAIVLPPMATMLASGLWHGGGSGLLAWGAVHGSYLVVERAGLQLRRPAPGAEPRVAVRLLGPAAVFLLGGLTMPLFRTSLPAAVDMWRTLFVAHGWTVPSARPLVFILPSLALDAWQA